MAKFGLDQKFITKFNKELDIDAVRQDQGSDFFILPQLDAIYNFAGDSLKDLVASKLGAGTYGPKPPIDMEVPKSARVSARSMSVNLPNYFRPGSVLYPEDRVIYHFFGQETCEVVEEAIDRERVMSNRPLKKKGAGFSPAAIQWTKLKNQLEKAVKSEKYSLVLRCDLAQYFFSINQHEMINQLEHQGLPNELVSFGEKYLSGLTLDRSSRGIIQGIYGSDVLGNGYLIAIDEFISDCGHIHFRYVDDIYILFETSDEFRTFFPQFVRRLRDYDLSLNESKTFVSPPLKLAHQETELDKAIDAAKQEAIEQLTDYEEVEIETGPYGQTATELLEYEPDDDEVELEATRSIFENLDDFKGEERHRAESFCLSIFRRAADPIAIQYVLKRWLRNPDRAREYALYLNRFAATKKHAEKIAEKMAEISSSMIEFQWAWAALVMRRFPKISKELLTIAASKLADGGTNEVVRSLLVYTVTRHGSAQQKKQIRDSYASSPLLVQLAVIHCSKNFTSGERSALLKTAEAHGDLQSLMCQAYKAEQASAQKTKKA